MERYNRQIQLSQIGESGQKKLNLAKVLIVGVGGLGSPIALYLAGAGVGTIGLIDDDIVSVNNLQRQILYSETAVGQPKALQAQKRLQELNSEIIVKSYPHRLTQENAQEIISGYDIVVDGCDNFTTRFIINDTCLALNKIFVHGAIKAFEGQVSVFNYPGGHSNYRTLYPNEDEILNMPHPPKGVMGITPGIVGCMEANETIKIICGIGQVLSDKLWVINLLSLQTHIISL